MSSQFNLFLLHSRTDIHPRTWICFGGRKIGAIFKSLEKKVLMTKGLNKENLSKLISSKFNCSHNTIKRILQRKSNFYPIPIILELLSLVGNRRYFEKNISANVEYLKVNSASAKPIKAVYKLNNNLAKILGAFMADGSLSAQTVIAASNLEGLKSVGGILRNTGIRYSLGKAKSRSQCYINIQVNKKNQERLEELIVNNTRGLRIQTHFNIELTEEYKDSAEAFNRWVKEEFGINPTSFKKRKRAWRTIFSNKLLARYLMKYFSASPGPKTYDAFEPEIIRKSRLLIRKNFAKGVLVFDGCVTMNNKISFSTVSKNLFHSIRSIWAKDKIEFGNSFSGRGENVLFTTSNNKKGKLLEYFERNTQKWKLLRWLDGNIDYHPIIKKDHFLSTEKILGVLRGIKQCDTFFFQKHFGCTHTTIRTYLKILENQGLIKLSNCPDGISDHVEPKATVLLARNFHNLLFRGIKKRFGNYKNCAHFLEIHKATISTWKLRKIRIPLYILRKFCSILQIDYYGALRNVIKVDREIAGVIQ